MSWYNMSMKNLVVIVKNSLDEVNDKSNRFNLIKKVEDQLLTPDVRIAMMAGCKFDLNITKEDETGVTLCLKSKDRVSILKGLDGNPISVIVKKDETNRI